MMALYAAERVVSNRQQAKQRIVTKQVLTSVSKSTVRTARRPLIPEHAMQPRPPNSRRVFQVHFVPTKIAITDNFIQMQNRLDP